jgi:muramoyltetrapeptide carboxypeptidase
LRSARFNLPEPLPANACIGVFAPSGVVNMVRLGAAITALEALGHRVIVAPETGAQWRYFAGTDEERLAGFHSMLADPDIDMMMMARGGYGWSRLLHRIDWPAVAASRKAFCGFSDFTAFSLAALARANLVSFAGPGAAIDFGGEDDDEDIQVLHRYTQSHCWPALRGEPVRTEAFACEHGYPAQTIEGPLWGGNLSMLSHLVGTPYMPGIEGGILFVEEIAEQPYAIERMLLQLFHAGILQKQRALLLADFTDCEPAAGRFPYSMAHVIDTLRTLLPYPVLSELPFGHVAKKLTLPFGADATLAIGDGAYTLSY